MGPPSHSPLHVVLSVIKTRVDYEGLWNCFPKAVFSFLISPALFARKKSSSEAPLRTQGNLCWHRAGGANCCCQGRVFALKCPECETQRQATSSSHQDDKTGGSLQIKQLHKARGPGSAQHRTQGREYLTPESHLDSQKTALPRSKYPALPGEQGVSEILRVGVTSTARASRDPQVCVGSPFLMGKKVHQQIRHVVGNVCHKDEIKIHTHTCL